ncbi:VC0807 family protein [Streptoalloteichus hindustanus]|uniref:Intracellular septation protein A n=1 Tax=Streptoalloteichus hindustanus TaxID=2017 RepID=A0A1M5MIG6_STRHI|nr:VC0807 family protein [Streptoalloteichus hindustanus]SHG77046.1 hypothetical protein SAMN05444320_113130 [Streptoalloteichus hindustanus]
MSGPRREIGAERRAGTRALLRRNAAAVAFDVVVPMAAYYGLRLAGVGQWWALMAGVLIALPHPAYRLARDRRLDLMAVFTVSVMVFSVVIGLLTDDPRALVVRESWVGALLGLLGAWMLVTVLRGRPALLVLGRTVAVTRTGESGAREWEARWEHDHRFRSGMRVLTAVWGAVLLVDTVVNIALVYLLPIDLVALVPKVQWWVVLAGLLAFHLRYTKKAQLRA